MPTYTSYFNLAKPTVNDPVDADQWGTLLNNDIDSIDGLLRGVTSAKSASFTVQTTEFGQIYLCNATSAAIIATLPSAATAGNGFKVAFKKTDSSANAVTLTPNGADTIDGAATYALTTQYSSVVVVSNGSVWSVISGGGDMKATIRANESYTFLGSYTASSSASINITSKITSEFDEYVFVIQDFVPSSSGASIGMKTSSDNGSTWSGGAADYSTSGIATVSGSTVISHNNGNASFISFGGAGNAAGYSTSAIIKLLNPLNTSYNKKGTFQTFSEATTGELICIQGAWRRTSTAQINAVQFIVSTGTISTGTVRVYGLRKV